MKFFARRLPLLVYSGHKTMTSYSTEYKNNTVEGLVAKAWVEFNRRTVSQQCMYVLWGSFESAEDLVKRYLAYKGESDLLDGRRKPSESQNERLEAVRHWAHEAVSYRAWARDQSGDPILRDLIIAYCAAFENALKLVALAFLCASGDEGRQREVAIPTAELKRCRVIVKEYWKKYSKDDGSAGGSTAERFYQAKILDVNPFVGRWDFFPVDQDVCRSELEVMDGPSVSEGGRRLNDLKRRAAEFSQRNEPNKVWRVVKLAFKLRNKIIHQNGYIDERLEIDDDQIFEGDEVEVDVRKVRRIHEAMLRIMDPIRPREAADNL